MEVVRLEDFWTESLTEKGWSRKCIVQFLNGWAISTWASYNSSIKQLQHHCIDNNIVFPPVQADSALFAEFFSAIAERSSRPESVLKTASAAVSCLFQAMNTPNPCDSYPIRKMITGLVKAETSAPAKKTPVMPCAPFLKLFREWKNPLSIKQLRLRAITLLALCIMARPSDLAPRAQNFTLTTDQVLFHEDGSMSITLVGTKNDKDRKRFQVNIPGGSDGVCDPVRALKEYIKSTTEFRQKGGPLFISLKKPFISMQAAGINQVLKEAIQLSGLEGYTPRSFRATGATAAMHAETEPGTAMSIGRWRSEEVFRAHYVHPRVQSSYTDKVLSFSGAH